mgnify:CR=1 FL=1
MSKQITIDIKTFARLWGEVDIACNKFLQLKDEDSFSSEEAKRLNLDGYIAADLTRAIMQIVANYQGVSTQDLKDVFASHYANHERTEEKL